MRATAVDPLALHPRGDAHEALVRSRVDVDGAEELGLGDRRARGLAHASSSDHDRTFGIVRAPTTQPIGEAGKDRAGEVGRSFRATAMVAHAQQLIGRAQDRARRAPLQLSDREVRLALGLEGFECEDAREDIGIGRVEPALSIPIQPERISLG